MKTVLMMAITLDGKIAKTSNHPANWTSKADKKIFVSETKKAGVIVMGLTTYQTIGRPLPGRLNVVMDFEPEKYEGIPGELEYTKSQPKELLKELADRGFNTVILGGGASINGLFLKENLIDELWLTIEPKIFGEGLSLFSGADMNLDIELIESKKLDDNVLWVRYKVIK